MQRLGKSPCTCFAIGLSKIVRAFIFGHGLRPIEASISSPLAGCWYLCCVLTKCREKKEKVHNFVMHNDCSYPPQVLMCLLLNHWSPFYKHSINKRAYLSYTHTFLPHPHTWVCPFTLVPCLQLDCTYQALVELLGHSAAYFSCGRLFFTFIRGWPNADKIKAYNMVQSLAK